MKQGDLIITLVSHSSSGFTDRRVVLPIADIVALEEESVPTKDRRRTLVHTNYRTFKTDDDIDTLLNRITDALSVEAKHKKRSEEKDEGGKL